jgi:hypothetical protein
MKITFIEMVVIFFIVTVLGALLFTACKKEYSTDYDGFKKCQIVCAKDYDHNLSDCLQRCVIVYK